MAREIDRQLFLSQKPHRVLVKDTDFWVPCRLPEFRSCWREVIDLS